MFGSDWLYSLESPESCRITIIQYNVCVCVSYRDRLLHVSLVEQGMVNAQDYPVKQGTVQRLGHGVPGCDRLEQCKRQSTLDRHWQKRMV